MKKKVVLLGFLLLLILAAVNGVPEWNVLVGWTADGDPISQRNLHCHGIGSGCTGGSELCLQQYIQVFPSGGGADGGSTGSYFGQCWYENGVCRRPENNQPNSEAEQKRRCQPWDGGFGDPSVCGDGKLATSELCDDGDQDSSDYCANCVPNCEYVCGRPEFPGDSTVYWPHPLGYVHYSCQEYNFGRVIPVYAKTVPNSPDIQCCCGKCGDFKVDSPYEECDWKNNDEQGKNTACPADKPYCDVKCGCFSNQPTNEGSRGKAKVSKLKIGSKIGAYVVAPLPTVIIDLAVGKRWSVYTARLEGEDALEDGVGYKFGPQGTIFKDVDIQILYTYYAKSADEEGKWVYLYRYEDETVDKNCSYTILNQKSQVLEPSGGVFELDDVKVDFPVGAVDTPITIWVQKLNLDCGEKQDATSLQGRVQIAPSGKNQSNPVVLELMYQDGNRGRKEATADAYGNFLITDLKGAAVTAIFLKPRYYLGKRYEAGTFSLGTFDFGDFSSRYGDFNNDNRVNFQDIGSFSVAYGSSCGESRYKSYIDYDRSCKIDLTDYSALRRNYGKLGDTSIFPPPMPAPGSKSMTIFFFVIVFVVAFGIYWKQKEKSKVKLKLKKKR